MPRRCRACPVTPAINVRSWFRTVDHGAGVGSARSHNVVCLVGRRFRGDRRGDGVVVSAGRRIRSDRRGIARVGAGGSARGFDGGDCCGCGSSCNRSRSRRSHRIDRIGDSVSGGTAADRFARSDKVKKAVRPSSDSRSDLNETEADAGLDQRLEAFALALAGRNPLRRRDPHADLELRDHDRFEPFLDVDRIGDVLLLQDVFELEARRGGRFKAERLCCRGSCGVRRSDSSRGG